MEDSLQHLSCEKSKWNEFFVYVDLFEHCDSPGHLSHPMESWKLDMSTASTRNHTTYITFQWKIIHFHHVFLQFPIPRIFLRIKNPTKSELWDIFSNIFFQFFVLEKPLEKFTPNSIGIWASEPGVRSIRALLSASLRCGVCVVLSCIRRGEGEETSTRGLGLNGEGARDTQGGDSCLDVPLEVRINGLVITYL